MVVTLDPNESRILIGALSRMDDDARNHKGNLAIDSEGEDTMLAFTPCATGWCFEGHLMLAAADVFGMAPPPLIDEDWEPLWDFQSDLIEMPEFATLIEKLIPFFNQYLKVTGEQASACGSDTAYGPLAWANDVYGTAHVRDEIRRGIASGEIVVAA